MCKPIKVLPVTEYDFVFPKKSVARMSEAERYANVQDTLEDSDKDIELKAFNQHWQRTYFQLMPKYRFRVVGLTVVMYDGCYYVNTSPVLSAFELEERVKRALSYGMSQIFPSLP